MDQKISELIEISRYYGTNNEYVIAGGGNTSFKNEEYLWIKASGVSLADISEHGFVCMSRNRLQVISQKQYSPDSSKREVEVKEDMLKAIVSDGDLRPSVETSLHEVINYPFVIHTHPTLVNALMCSGKAREMSFNLLGEDILFIEYTDPGYVLFKKISDELSFYRKSHVNDPKVILLENHGIFVCAGSIEEVKEIYARIERSIKQNTLEVLPLLNIRNFQTSLMKEIKALYIDTAVIQAISNDLINSFVKDEASFELIRTAFTPDHIVYCKSRYLFVDEQNDNPMDQIISFKRQFGYMPKIIGIKGKGLLIIDNSTSSVDIVKELILNMMKISFFARSFGGSKSMTDKQIAFIENWEAENYRKKMAEKK